MPRLDGTGPNGQGVGTGRGRGNCEGTYGHNYGRGCGRFRGRGFGLGRGFNNSFKYDDKNLESRINAVEAHLNELKKLQKDQTE